MGQQPSKKFKRPTKDEDENLSTVSSNSDAQTNLLNQGTSSLSRVTASSTLEGSDSSSNPNGNPFVNVSEAGTSVSSEATHSRSQGSPYPATALISNFDTFNPLSDLTPLSSPATTTVPLDIHNNQTILSNADPIGPPSSMTGNGNGRTCEGNGAAKDQFDIDDMIQRLRDVGYTVSKSLCLKNAEITAICLAARDVLLSQPTLIELPPPFKIVGNLHGQYSDLIRLFKMCGFPPAANYLFLGDYVDYGKQGLETILLLLCYKIKYPENFFLLRGNHECANVTRAYGFYDECKRRCNIRTWNAFIDVFNCLPIAAIVGSKIFCVHSGISPSLHSMEDIKCIQRPTEIPDYGLLNDLLCSEPSSTALYWEENERGASYWFGEAIVNEFLVQYDMAMICRGCKIVENGYKFWNDHTLVTISSAPKYTGESDNYGACMSISEDLFCTFELLQPLDRAALGKEIPKAKRKR